MLNKSGITKTTLAATRQILANVELQASVGCIVPEALGVAVGTKVIAKAGTPINIDLMDLQEAVKAPAAAVADPATPAVPLNAVLLHDVDVTTGAANGTALYFGMVNVNRVATDVAKAIEDARAIEGATQLLTFLSV